MATVRASFSSKKQTIPSLRRYTSHTTYYYRNGNDYHFNLAIPDTIFLCEYFSFVDTISLRIFFVTTIQIIGKHALTYRQVA